MTLDNDRQFAAALADCCARVQRGESLEGCLNDYPAAYRDELRRLVPLTARVAALGSAPSPLFRAALEQRLIGAVEARRLARAQGWSGTLGGWFTLATFGRLAAVAAVVIVLLVGGGVSASRAAEDSLPGSPFYGLKRVRERIEQALARDDEASTMIAVKHVERREQEMETAVRQGARQAIVDQTAREVQETTGPWVARALAAAAGGNYAPAEEVRNRIQTFERRVSNLLNEGPPVLRPTLTRLWAYLAEQDRLLTAVLETRRDAPRSEPPLPAVPDDAPVRTPPATRDGGTAAEVTPVAPTRPAPIDLAPARAQLTAIATAAPGAAPVRPEATPASAPVRQMPSATAPAPARPEPSPTATATVPVRLAPDAPAPVRPEPTPTPFAPARPAATPTRTPAPVTR